MVWVEDFRVWWFGGGVQSSGGLALGEGFRVLVVWLWGRDSEFWWSGFGGRVLSLVV